jgi:hypothetical protein
MAGKVVQGEKLQAMDDEMAIRAFSRIRARTLNEAFLCCLTCFDSLFN